ncbi:hypothetical protein HFN_0240 [Helicobacter fennelliae MRY12-0050]|uniref:Uncharacterized protein n=1 Tax=Helicobacter fennelliae MRY12-0050 TaxID=1325130 RepID=T1CQU0_9HELI|nr:hypothetical protein HFN_0240 [Helicobacter fennelliae MRY12-0050]
MTLEHLCIPLLSVNATEATYYTYRYCYTHKKDRSTMQQELFS